MPKCVTPGCDQTAFYGTVFNMPRWCKAHMVANSGSVRRKCAMFDCQNAVFTPAPECERCGRVIATIENFRRKSLDELKSAVDKENANILTQPPIPTRVPQSAPAAPLPDRASPGRALRDPVRTMAPPGQPVALHEPAQMKSATSLARSQSVKIVRIPDDAGAHPSDLAAAKKRAQTPGRPRSTNHSQNA